MLIPSDPNKMTGLWDALEASLHRDGLVPIVSASKVRPEGADALLAIVDAKAAIDRLRSLEFVRIGTERLLPHPPHFGVRLDDDRSTAVLSEYFAAQSSRETISRDITFFIDLAFFHLKSLKNLKIPFDVEGLPVTGFNIRYDAFSNSSQVSRL